MEVEQDAVKVEEEEGKNEGEEGGEEEDVRVKEKWCRRQKRRGGKGRRGRMESGELQLLKTTVAAH